MKSIAVLFCLLLASGARAAPAPDVRLETDQARAALAILEIMASGGEPSDADWERLWQSNGYRRLLERETAMGRGDGFGEALRDWLSRDETVARHAEYRAAVERWHSFDARRAGERAAAYLPAGIPLDATLYPVIKHTRNSFVFDLGGDPSIFMNIDPAHSPAYLEAVMTHELHHVGLSRCEAPRDRERLGEAQKKVLDWLGVFGEGLAVLATAGSPFRHPHYYSDAGEYLVWERDVANIATDIVRMQAFFNKVLDGTLPEDRQRKELFSFIATGHVPQGPAYTVGWKMAVVVERHHGRDALLGALCDPRELMRLYNAAARETGKEGGATLPLWSEDFLSRLRAGG